MDKLTRTYTPPKAVVNYKTKLTHVQKCRLHPYSLVASTTTVAPAGPFGNNAEIRRILRGAHPLGAEVSLGELEGLLIRAADVRNSNGVRLSPSTN